MKTQQWNEPQSARRNEADGALKPSLSREGLGFVRDQKSEIRHQLRSPDKRSAIRETEIRNASLREIFNRERSVAGSDEAIQRRFVAHIFWLRFARNDGF
ncbi:MAG: hypothetical protein FWC35_01560 [Proteobacteria bacterium]|nr:hypothetical protein [Pseudomonadota bacterium]